MIYDLRTIKRNSSFIHKSYFLNLKSCFSFALSVLVLSFALCALSLDKAGASTLSLGVYPPIIKIEAKPPASIKTAITIENAGEETVHLGIVFKPFKAKQSENGEVLYDSAQTFDFADPFIFQRMQIFDDEHNVNSITLAPGQQKTLTLHIGILKDEPLADYYFSIIFSSNPESIEESNSSQNIGAIATNVLLSIGPKGDPKGIIEEFSVPFFLDKGPVPFNLRVKNEGERVIMPTGDILIKNMFGQRVGRVNLLPVNILKDSIRAIPDSLQNPEATPSSISNFKFQISNSPRAYWYETFLLGPYSADLTLAISENGPMVRRTIYFFGFPTQVAIGLVIAIILTLIVVSRIKRKISE